MLYFSARVVLFGILINVFETSLGIAFANIIVPVVC